MDTRERFQVHPFDRFANLFQLHLSEGQVYRLIGGLLTEEQMADENILMHDDEVFSLEQIAGSEKVEPSLELIKRFIQREFIKKAEIAKLNSKREHKYIMYYAPTQVSHPHQDVFSVFRGFEYRVKILNDELYLAINPHLVFQINLSIEDLIKRGLDVRKCQGLSVRYSVDTQAGIDGYLLETQVSLSNGDEQPRYTCQVKEYRTGERRLIDASQVFFEPRPEIIRWILEELGHKYDVVELQRRESYLSSEQPSRDRLNATNVLVKFLSENVFPLIFGEFRVNLDIEALTVKGTEFPVGKTVKAEPKLLFDETETSAVHVQSYWGLRNFGPYTKNRPTLNVTLFGPKADLNILEKIVDDLNSGKPIMPGGIKRFFNTRLLPRRFPLQGRSDAEYIERAHDFVQTTQLSDVDVVMVYLPEKTSKFKFDTPYYACKAIFASRGFTTQMITPSTLQNLKWSYVNLGAATYAKAGCTPWVLEAELLNCDMVLGVSISHAVSSKQRAGTRQRYVGSANIFDRNGRWLFFEGTSYLYDRDQRVEQLSELVRNSMRMFKSHKGFYPRRIMLHYYKYFSAEEIDVVENIFKTTVNQNDIEDYEIAFIRIDDSHPLRLYDLANPDGSFPRGGYVLLRDNEILLSTTGYTPIAGLKMGTPRILHICVEQRPHEFISMADVAEQVLGLTKLNYATATPLVREPVTLSFSRTLANFSAVFSEQQWKDMITKPEVSATLKTRLWFL